MNDLLPEITAEAITGQPELDELADWGAELIGELARAHAEWGCALAGGVLAGVGSDTVVITGTRDGRPFRKEVDLPRLFSSGGASEDMVVAPGDTVWVDRAPQIFLYGEIQHSGAMRLERGMTVMQAVAAGGGATPRGTLKGIKVTRRGPDGKTQTIEPSMEDTLKDGDVVYIRESLF